MHVDDLKMSKVYSLVVCLGTITVCSIYILSYVKFPKAVMTTFKDTTVNNNLKSVFISNDSDINKTATKVTHNLVYVKTHKTGSSFVLHILQHAKVNKLPKAKGFPFCFLGGYPGHIRFKHIKSEGTDIGSIMGHMRFDADELHGHMPKNTRYISVIREPWSQFQSAFNYYGHKFPSKAKANCFHMPIAFVLNKRSMDVVRFMHECARTLNKSVPWYFRFKNYQSHDLGFDPTLEDQDEIERQIKALDKNMDLVMINEYMDESLILLKDILQLDWSMLRYWGKINKKSYKKLNLKTTDDRLTFSKLNNIDIALYRHFNETFWRKVESYGRKKMEEDLLKLKKIRGLKRRTRGIDKQNSDHRSRRGIQNDIKKYMLENSGGCLFSRD